MEIDYGDVSLRRLARDLDQKSNHLEPKVIQAYRRRLQSLGAADSMKDLRALRSLDFREEGDSSGAPRYSVRLLASQRLVLEMRDERTGPVLVVCAIVEVPVKGGVR